MKKYRITEMLNRLNKADYDAALAALPGMLNISKACLNNYRNIMADAPQDIPHIIVAKLEKYFGLLPGELQNFEVDINIRKNDTGDSLAKKFNLVKP